MKDEVKYVLNRIGWSIGIAWLTAMSSCGRKSSVEQITVESSRVPLYDQAMWLSTADWPAWRGPRNDGTVIDQAIVTQWDEESNIVWVAEVPGRGHSSPIVVGDHVYLATAVDYQQQLVLAYDRHSGESLWSSVVHEGGLTDKSHQKGTYANGTVAGDGKHLFAAFLNRGRVHVTALDTEGNTLWQKDLGPFQSAYGYAPSPILYRSLVLVAADHVDGGYLAALDRDSGNIAWRTPRPAARNCSSPLVASVAGEPQLLIGGCDQVASFNPSTGQLNWSCRGTSEVTCGTVVTDGENVFASGGYPDRETICVRGDGSGNVAWRNQTKVYEPSMLLAGDDLFAITDDGIAYCWAAATGELQWRKRLGGSFSASPILCNGQIFVASSEGECFVFEATGEAYRHVAKNKLGDDCYASFAVSHNCIFTRVGFREDGERLERLYCIGASTQ